ncbi:hypothetical protein KAFR_0H00630 [Kazachstania africana CBS 2517]|uniref:Uncharacterized protein n=1 Tax=Kazachstania africana (strain ATCC 22294 / BCRC 22015 / CBS 2517 / CECT 1963 / NBRC 1671 / NRRL Y-8276) TaxID=1071382 RepID=H2AYR6_KAZAF|nr:hypothetical protein KAFR_0H00630 [Kazachstania africana CBS 2517]CCF59472.1 hypothetical protein KAFR_0H00630 [Kazachstania africana CBS 2517]
MTKFTADKDQFSSIKIDTVVPPDNILDMLIIAGVCLPSVCYFNRDILTLTLSPLNMFIPQLGNGLLRLLNNDSVLISIIILEFAVHLTESLVFLRPRLNYYNVPSRCAIKWYFWGIIEGYSPVRRINRLASSNSSKIQ